MNHKFFTCLGIIALALSACSDPAPDLIVHNATILTMDTDLPRAQAFTVKDGAIGTVGTDDVILAMAGDETELIDAKGKTVLPGFNDAHLHAVGVPAGSLDASEDQSIDVLVDRLKASASFLPKHGWIVTHAYDDTELGRHLTRHDLDRVSSTHPVLALHASLHLFAVNSVALNAAGIDESVKDPEGAKFYRDDEGQLTGLIGERAALEMLFTEDQSSPLPSDLTSALEAVSSTYDVLHANGITSFTDALVPPELALVFWLSDPEEKGIRVNLLFDSKKLDLAKSLVGFDELLNAIGLGQLDNHWLKGRGIKVFHGNSLSGRTARLKEPYFDRPDYYGEEPERSQADLDNLIEDIHVNGMQAAIHANGDYEIDMVLQSVEKVQEAYPRVNARHRIEHGSVMNEDLLIRMKEQGMVFAPHSYIYEKGPMLEAYGPDRWKFMFPNKTAIDMGIPNAANSDFPVSALNPFLRIQSLMTRTSKKGKVYGPEQRLSAEEALYAYTMGGAYATFEEDVKGSITAGKFADFIILSDDPTDLPADQVRHISVEQTWVDGIQRYSR